MSEKLIPFDFAAFQADPSRLRMGDGRRPAWAEPVRDCVAVVADELYLLYQPPYHSSFRLAVKTRKVRVRLLRDNGDKRVLAYTSDYNDLDLATAPNRAWIGEAFDVEVPE